MSSTLRIALIGAAGRMGRAIEDAARGNEDVTIVARCDIGDSVEAALAQCDVAIDFSHASATTVNCAAAVANRKPLVIGTTGQSKEQLKTIRDATQQIPILLAPNFSVGVNVLFHLAREAAELLGPDFDLEIIEAHHRLKKDAPSGTAKRLAEILAGVRGLGYGEDVAHGRRGLIGERPAEQIGMHALRGGDIVGDHTVLFAGRGERVELTHKASSRETFSMGALRAAQWIFGKPAGQYGMEDVLGLTSARV